jgi:hypothetical protein
MVVVVLSGTSPLHAWIGSNPLLCQHPHLVVHPEEDPHTVCVGLGGPGRTGRRQ